MPSRWHGLAGMVPGASGHAHGTKVPYGRVGPRSHFARPAAPPESGPGEGGGSMGALAVVRADPGALTPGVPRTARPPGPVPARAPPAWFPVDPTDTVTIRSLWAARPTAE